MKKSTKIIITVVSSILVLIIFLVILKLLMGLSVSYKDKKYVKEFAINYLNNRYGDHNYKITKIKYDYNMEYVLDYSNPEGYWVYFKSDVVPSSFITLEGLKEKDLKVDSDLFIEDYYYPDKDGYDKYESMKKLIPKEKIEKLLLKDLKNEFDNNIYAVECNDTIVLNVPENYGKIPTKEDLKTDPNLYEILSFTYKVNNKNITEEYKSKLSDYIKNKYNTNAEIYNNLGNPYVDISFEKNIRIKEDLD